MKDQKLGLIAAGDVTVRPLSITRRGLSGGKDLLTKLRTGSLMRILLLIAALFFLVGCDTGTKNYWGVAPQRIAAQGMTFDVRVNGLMAEALRQNMMAFPRDADVAAAAAQAMAKASGCQVLQVRGDASIMEGRLQCGSQKAPAFRKKPQTVLCRVQSNKSAPQSFEDYHLTCD